MVLGQKHAKNRLTACHGHGVIPTLNSALCLHKLNIWFAIYLSLNLVTVSHIKACAGILWSLPDSCFPILCFFSSPFYSSKSFLAQSCLKFGIVKSKLFFLHPKYEKPSGKMPQPEWKWFSGWHYLTPTELICTILSLITDNPTQLLARLWFTCLWCPYPLSQDTILTF